MQLVYMYMDSPVGALKLVAHDQALVAVMWDNEDHKRVRLAKPLEDHQHPMLQRVKKLICTYNSCGLPVSWTYLRRISLFG